MSGFANSFLRKDADKTIMTLIPLMHMNKLNQTEFAIKPCLLRLVVFKDPLLLICVISFVFDRNERNALRVK